MKRYQKNTSALSGNMRLKQEAVQPIMLCLSYILNNYSIFPKFLLWNSELEWLKRPPSHTILGFNGLFHCKSIFSVKFRGAVTNVSLFFGVDCLGPAWRWDCTSRRYEPMEGAPQPP